MNLTNIYKVNQHRIANHRIIFKKYEKKTQKITNPNAKPL